MSGIAPEDSTTPDDLPSDLLWDILADKERRHLLLFLQDCDEPTGINQLARLLSAEIPSAGLDTAESLQINLHHFHLPKLAQAGMITRTEDNEAVQLTDRGHAVVTAPDESTLVT